MRGQADFVNVKRLKHGDTMYIVREVAEKYPDRFEIIKTRKKRVATKDKKKE